MKKEGFVTTFLVVISSLSAFGQWVWLNPKPSGLTGTDVVFVNDQKGFIVNTQQLLTTTNGGSTWEVKQGVYGGTRVRFRKSRGFIVGNYGAVYRSNHTGDTWKQLSVSSLENFHSVHILHSDSTHL